MTLAGSLMQSGVPARRSWRVHTTWWALTLVLVAVAPPVWAAGITVANQDRNARINVRDARINGSGTTVLYSTRPEEGQPHWKQKCTMNFYLLKLQAGLPSAQPELLTENYCPSGALLGFSVSAFSAALLANGDVLINGEKQMEIWRPGAGIIKAWSLSDIDLPQGSGNGNILTNIARDGNIVLARPYLRQRNDTQTPSAIVLGLTSEGATRWRLKLDKPGVQLDVMEIWADAKGGALLHVRANPMSGSGLPDVQAPAGAIISSQNRLYRISAKGELMAPIVIASFQLLDFSNPPPPLPDMTEDPEGYQAGLIRMQSLTKTESIAYGETVVHPLDDGSMDVLIGRSSRKARFLRIGPDGSTLLDISFDQTLEQEGLTNWTDFSSSQNQLILFGALGTRKDRLNQGFISWIDIPDGGIVTRLAPLSKLGLEAARNADNEQVQNLEHNPTQRPQMLTSLAGKPLTVSLIYQSRRVALQLDEGNEELAVYTERRDDARARVAKKAQSKQRKANQEAMSQQINSDMAAAVGMSAEEFAALSNEEQYEAMIRNGDFDAMMAATTKQYEQLAKQMQTEQAQAGQQAGGMQAMPPGMPPEMAAALANAGIVLPNMPGVSSMQGMPSAPGIPAATSSTAPTSGADPLQSDKILKVDAGKRGFIEFENPENKPTMLVILDRQTGKELLKKEYADGVIYEYVDFNQFNLPLGQIGVLFKDADGRMLKELTPAVLP